MPQGCTTQDTVSRKAQASKLQSRQSWLQVVVMTLSAAQPVLHTSRPPLSNFNRELRVGAPVQISLFHPDRPPTFPLLPVLSKNPAFSFFPHQPGEKTSWMTLALFPFLFVCPPFQCPKGVEYPTWGGEGTQDADLAR